MPRHNHQLVIAGIFALLGMAFVMAHSIAGEGAGDAKVTAVAPATASSDPDSFDRTSRESWVLSYHRLQASAY
jgi:hypothetical protein